MREKHGLRVLHVRHARGGGITARLGLRDQRGLQLGQPAHHPPRVVPQVHPQVGGHLVVAAAASPKLAAEGAQPLEQPALQRGVHVLVGDRRTERPVLDRPVQVVERVQHRFGLAVAEQPGTVQRPRVRAGREQVVTREPPVELDA